MLKFYPNPDDETLGWIFFCQFFSVMYVDIFWSGCIAKNFFGKIRNLGKWSVTENVRWPDIDFLVWVRLQFVLPIKINKKQILAGRIVHGDEKLEEGVSRKLLTSLDDQYWGHPTKVFTQKIILKVFCNKGET